MDYIISPEKLCALGKKWIVILGLNDWNIILKIKRKADMEIGESQGQVTYNTVGKQAIVTIMDHVDWDNKEFYQDMEKTLVHELLHLKFSLLDTDNTLRDKIIHQLIDDLSRSFIKASRDVENG